MSEETPREAGDVPEERQAEENPSGAPETNVERQGPGPTDAPTDDDEPDQGPSGPPPESIPGDSGNVPNPS